MENEADVEWGCETERERVGGVGEVARARLETLGCGGAGYVVVGRCVVWVRVVGMDPND